MTTYKIQTDKNGRTIYYRVTDGKKKKASRAEYEAYAANARTNEEIIEEYREIYAVALQHNVKRSDLTGDVETDGATLIERINARRIKWGYNTDWKGELWVFGSDDYRKWREAIAAQSA